MTLDEEELMKILEGESLAEIKQKVGKLEVKLSKPTPSFQGINGYKYNVEDIAKHLGLDPKKIREWAFTGYAPCIISTDGEPLFKKGEFLRLAEKNVYRRSDGRNLPFHITLYSNKDRDYHSPIPKTLRGINNLMEFEEIVFPSCIYFLVKNDEVIYVGQTIELPSRLASHRQDKLYDRVFYLPVPESDLNRVEKEFIITLKPKLNGGPRDYTKRT
ncbi:hypothetical protein HYW74_02625 [Candidatus Pacearchaeota archaeon]|nr:hypothetical protein [Candidatus Pacearchaeota archaeon]